MKIEADEISRILSDTKTRVSIAACGFDSWRTNVCLDSNNQIVITLNIHWLCQPEAERLIRNIIVMMRRSFRLQIIHGYRHGTVLKDMVQMNQISSRIYERSVSSCNPGISLMKVCA